MSNNCLTGLKYEYLKKKLNWRIDELGTHSMSNTLIYFNGVIKKRLRRVFNIVFKNLKNFIRGHKSKTKP